MKTYLVTGGAGFIGSNYIHYMFKKYGDTIRIINVDCLTYAGNLENLKDIEDKENYTFIKADICDGEEMIQIFEENDIDRVVHFAAESHVDRSIKNPDVFVKTNVLRNTEHAERCKECLGVAGTFKERVRNSFTFPLMRYTVHRGRRLFLRNHSLCAHSPYSASKASSDMLVKAYMDTYHFPANITNCSNNYSPYRFSEKLIPYHQQCPARQETAGIRRRQERPRLALCRGSRQGNRYGTGEGRLFETYNIGGHNEKQNIEIIHIILDTLQGDASRGDREKALVSEDLITYVEDRKGHDRRYAIAPDKIKAEVGWYPDLLRRRHQEDDQMVFRA